MTASPTWFRRCVHVAGAMVGSVALTACSSSDAEPADQRPDQTAVIDDGPEFTERDEDETTAAATPTVSDPSSVDEGSTVQVDQDEVPQETGSSSGASDPAADPGPDEDPGTADGTPSPTATTLVDPTTLTPDELEAGAAGPVDDEELRDLVDEAEEEFRERPDAEPGEIALANADLTYETRFFDGRATGATGTVEVPIGSIVAYSVVTDADDVLTLDGTDLRAPTNGDSVQLVFRADTAGSFVMLLEDSGTPLLELVVS